MKPRLIVHLKSTQPDENETVDWGLYDDEGKTLASGEGPLGRVRAQVGRGAEKAEVFAVCPGTAVTLTDVNIPSRQASHLRKALPFMIEEQLAGDLRQTHLAIIPARYGDSVPVAVVAHAQMIVWLQALHAAGLSPSALIPEQVLINREPGSIAVHIDGNRALVRLGDFRGIVVDVNNLAATLEVALHQGAISCSRIELTCCVNNVADIETADELAKGLVGRVDRPIKRTNFKESLLEIMANASRGRVEPLNLCQGGYRVDNRSGRGLGYWKSAWIAAAACILVFVVVNVSAGIVLKSRAVNTHAESVALFHKMFPDEHRIINLKRQAESRLGAAAATGTGPIPAIAQLAQSLNQPDASGVKIQSLRYSEEGLVASLSAGSLAQIDGLEKLLSGASPPAEISSKSEEGGVATAKLTLRSL